MISIFELVREVNTYKHNGGNHLSVLQKAWDVFALYGSDILGVLQLEKSEQEGLVDSLLDLLLELREELRRTKNFALADQIRNQLTDLGITIEDTPQGPRWKV